VRHFKSLRKELIVKINIEFNTKNTLTDNIDKTKKYFINNKFELVKNTTDTLTFKRGNILLNMVAFNPLKWKSNITINFGGISNNSIKLEADITTTGQLVTDKENELWNKFINNYKESIINCIDLTQNNKINLHDTIVHNYKFALKYIIYSLIGGLSIGIIRILIKIVFNA
jgi:hypothetical protein